MLLIYGRFYFTSVHLICVYIHSVYMAVLIWHDTVGYWEKMGIPPFFHTTFFKKNILSKFIAKLLVKILLSHFDDVTGISIILKFNYFSSPKRIVFNDFNNIKQKICKKYVCLCLIYYIYE